MAVIDAYGKGFNDVVGFSKNITIDLAARYAAAFGMMAVGKAIDKVFIEQKQNGDFALESYPDQLLGENGPDYAKLEIPGLDTLEFASMLHGQRGSIFAPPLLMSFSQEKSLVETEVNDDDPIIVERWGTKPWNITINGLLIDVTNRIYPSDDVRTLNKNWAYNGVIKAIGKQFEEKDIDSLYFRSIDFTTVEGYQDTVKFSINASSIKAVNFTLLKANS